MFDGYHPIRHVEASNIGNGRRSMHYKMDQTLHGAGTTSTTNIRTDINARLRMVRDVLGMSNADIARGSGMTRAYISRVVNNQTNIGVDLLLYLITQHAVSVDWLLTGKGAMMKSVADGAVTLDALSGEVRMLRETVERYLADPGRA